MSERAKQHLKRHAERLIKDVGFAAACDLTGRSKATLGRYFSAAEDHADRFMPVDAVAALEAVASFPHVTTALAELNGVQITLEPDQCAAGHARRDAGVNRHVVALSQRFAILMADYHRAIAAGDLSGADARRLRTETLDLQEVLAAIKLRLDGDLRG